MKNMEMLCSLMEKRWEGKFKDPIGFEDYVNAVAECFGSECEVEDFIKTGEYDYVHTLSEAYEEIVEKFPSDRLEYLFDKFVMTSYPNGVPTLPPKYDPSLDDWEQ